MKKVFEKKWENTSETKVTNTVFLTLWRHVLYFTINTFSPIFPPNFLLLKYGLLFTFAANKKCQVSLVVKYTSMLI